MIKRLPGYIIAGIAILGILYFGYYEGNVIPYTTFWFILSIVAFPVGLYIAYTSRTKKEISLDAAYSIHRNKLVTTGERIALDIDCCEIKEHDYYEEMPNQRRPDMQSIDAVFDPNENYEEKYIDQSVIIYSHKIGDATEKYISQAFPLGTETLTFHILNNDIMLYVDRFDRGDYLFELSEKPS